MTKKRTNYLYKFTGTIQKKYRRKSPEYTQHFYQLKAKLTGQSSLQKIFAFKNKAKSSVWNILEADEYVGKKYLFSCRNYQGSYYLVDWEEIKQ
ncbi:MAG: hypothetical protein MRECE_11c041 [Mycoplasmataceae bacterium CE_OT135]|nr:MAG: hypothetical protein MRECE_11c041 [Mycoplasmataceae bacterium CE_OT135]